MWKVAVAQALRLLIRTKVTWLKVRTTSYRARFVVESEIDFKSFSKLSRFKSSGTWLIRKVRYRFGLWFNRGFWILVLLYGPKKDGAMKGFYDEVDRDRSYDSLSYHSEYGWSKGNAVTVMLVSMTEKVEQL